MRAEARAFLEALDDGQRDVATYRLDDPERTRWQYTPGPRGGLPLADMDATQRDLAMALLESGLSVTGARTARAIIDLEPVLREIEEQAGRRGSERRNPEHYWFSVFGTPPGGPSDAASEDVDDAAADDVWGWRVGGHHLCLHFTAVGDRLSVTPLFFGANPARVPHGPHEGLRVLAAEEDLARDLIGSLDEERRARALVSDRAPDDILTGNAVRAEIAAVPTGVAFPDLDAEQQRAMTRLVDHYVGRVARPTRVDPRTLSFAWAGGTEPGARHYYAVRGDRFLIEYDNTQNDANHVHTVWRDLDGDWGFDLLADHYRHAHGP